MNRIKKFKHLRLYALAIGAVLLIFKIVSIYGETLQAAPHIGGRYLISVPDLPKCFASNNLVLVVQQSGIYLNGSLLVLKPNAIESNSLPIEEEITLDKPSLVGRWQNQKLTLSGLVPNVNSCAKTVNIRIQAVVNSENITGEINFNLTPQPVTFTARREVSQPLNRSSNPH